MNNLQHFNRIGKETDNSILLKREEDGFWNSSELKHSKFVNHVIKDMESGGRGRGSPNENDLGEVLERKPGTKGSKMLASEEENNDKLLNGPEFERMMVPSDCANLDEHELSNSGAQSITSKFFQADSTLYTDKSVMECDVPQLVVCCKDTDCQHVKDICVDKAGPLEEKGSIDKHTDNFVGPHVSMPSMEYGTNEPTRNLDYEFHVPDGLEPPAQVDFSDLTEDRCEAKIESKIICPVLSELECLPAGKVEENGPNSEAFMQASEKNVGNKIKKCLLVEEPLKSTVANSRDMSDVVSEKPRKADYLPSHNYRNFTDPLSSHVDRCADMDEGYVLDSEFRNSSNPFLVGEIQSSVKDGSTIDTHPETLLTNEGHSSNPFGVEVQSAIVQVSTEEILPTTIGNHKKENFNPFDSSESETLIIGKDSESIHQVQAESPKRRSTNNPFADCEVENADMAKNRESIDQQPEVSNNKIAGTNPLSVSDIHSSSEAKGMQYNNEQPELNHKGNSYNPFSDPELDDVGIDKIAGNAGTVIVPELESSDLRDLHNNEAAPKTVSFAYQSETGIGETSFSAVSGRITYSGPITISGSTSLRSDSSATSTRSFAFPVLQSEWNSSPVRMKRAGRRKEGGGWKNSIFCCKF
ncbi:hypothetical protein Leryth_012492 [Lithospermum erythrorhizon]|nr:hypothetical protein Leryth_012492 [Lithospermum erythrorhizon]